MKTEQILPATGIFTLGFFLGILTFSVWLLPHYQRAINHSHWADEVIKECIELNPDFFDTVAKGDAWNNYNNNR